MEVLKGLGTPILGTVMNSISSEWGSNGYGYGYGYGYGVYGYGRPSEHTPGLDTLIGDGHVNGQPVEAGVNGKAN